jgi:hypothetical protein
VTPITKAQNRVEELEKTKLVLPPFSAKIRKVDHQIEVLKAIIDLYIYRRRKTDKAEIPNLYILFEDEFNVRYDTVVDMITGKEEQTEN